MQLPHQPARGELAEPSLTDLGDESLLAFPNQAAAVGTHTAPSSQPHERPRLFQPAADARARRSAAATSASPPPDGKRPAARLSGASASSPGSRAAAPLSLTPHVNTRGGLFIGGGGGHSPGVTQGSSPLVPGSLRRRGPGPGVQQRPGRAADTTEGQRGGQEHHGGPRYGLLSPVPRDKRPPAASAPTWATQTVPRVPVLIDDKSTTSPQWSVHVHQGVEVQETTSVVEYSQQNRPARLMEVMREHRDMADQEAERELFAGGRQNVALGVLLLLLLATGVALSVLAVEQRRLDQIDADRAQFKRLMESYASSLQGFLSQSGADMHAWAVYLQRERSLDIMQDMYDAMETDLPHVLWVERVAHADRSAVESEIHDELAAALNTTDVPRNITQLITDSRGAVVGVEVSPPEPEYFVIRYIVPQFPPTNALRDVNSEPARSALLQAAMDSRSLAVSRRLHIHFADSVIVASSMAFPVYERSNETNLLGVASATLDWSVIVQSALENDAVANARVRVFDVTGDQADQLGCTYGLLFDGRREQSTGAWTSLSGNDTSAQCFASEAAIKALAGSDSVVQELLIGDRRFFVILDATSDFDADAPINAAFIAVAVVLGVLAIVLMVGVAVRGAKLIQELTKARRWAHEEMVHTASAEFEAVKALEQRDEFIAFLSHELRSPLFTVFGMVDTLSTLVDERGSEALVSIDGAASNMAATLDSVMRVQSVIKGDFEFDERMVNLDTVVKNSCSDHKVAAEDKQVELVYKWDERLPRVVRADKRVLSTILHHLLDNAIKYTEAGGSITVSVSFECEGRSPDIKLIQLANRAGEFNVPRSVVFASEVASDLDDVEEVQGVTVRLCVFDTGIGIESKRLHTIFEPFSSDRLEKRHRNAPPAELGLPTVKTLVKHMGGTVHAKSMLGEGSEFAVTLFLPTTPEDPHEALSDGASHVSSPAGSHAGSRAGSRVSSRIGSRSSRGGRVRPGTPSAVKQPWTTEDVRAYLTDKRVLVVEEDDTNRLIFASMLEKEIPGVRIAKAADGLQAVEEVQNAEAQGDPFALVFMDVHLSDGMTGVETSALLRGRRYRVPIMAVSGGGGGELDDTRRFRAAGMQGLLVKPFRRRDLMLALAKYGDMLQVLSPSAHV